METVTKTTAKITRDLCHETMATRIAAITTAKTTVQITRDLCHGTMATRIATITTADTISNNIIHLAYSEALLPRDRMELVVNNSKNRKCGEVTATDPVVVILTTTASIMRAAGTF
jgi:hypothetical protein